MSSAVDKNKIEVNYLFDKSTVCPVCEETFNNKTVKSSRLKLEGTDNDLRPRYKDIDTLKYAVISCPFCGYSAINNFFEHLSPIQIKMIKEEMCSKFHPDMAEMPEVFDYDFALERYELTLHSTIAKKAKISEIGYTCLRMAWLYRGKSEEMAKDGISTTDDEYIAAKDMEMAFYKQAYDAFYKALETESAPICGMDEETFELLLAQMGYILEDYGRSSKLVAALLGSKTASRKIKDKALELKKVLIAALKKG